MAYDFPPTPTVGQIANGYVWNGQAWTGNGNLSAVAPSSDGPPANPVSGQLWWESDSGNLFIWYVDANSSQWVQISGVGLSDAPSDGKVYARRDGIWVLKEETRDVSGKSIEIFLRPAWATRACAKLDVFGDTSDFATYIRLYNGGAPMATANYSGYGTYQDFSGLAFTSISVAGSTDVALGNSHGSINVANHVEVDVTMTRPSTAKTYGGKISARAFPNAGGCYMSQLSWLFTPSSGLAVDGFQLQRGGGTWGAGSQITVEWS